MPIRLVDKIILVPALMLLLWFGTEQMSVLKDGVWSHSRSEECDFNCRVKESGLLDEVEWVGENLYKGPTCDVRHAIQLWEKSESHKRILEMEYNRGIMLIYTNDEGQCYIVFDIGNYE